MTPEELRREIFEQNMKRRIFYSDRFEKVERALLKDNHIIQGALYCDNYTLRQFITMLTESDE